MTNKKIISVILISVILILVLILFSACGNIRSDKKDDADMTENSVAEGLISAEIDYYKNVPNGANYDGYAFKVLTWDPAVDGWNPYIIVEEITGEVLNDAAYDRNMEVMQLLNVEIAYLYKEYGTNIVNTVIKDNAAGDCSYDIVLPWGGRSNAPNLILQNQLYDWNKVPYVDLEADWYNQTANDAYTVNGKQYLCVSDLTYPLHNTFSILFNKDLFTDYGLDYPYQLVYDGKWTFDVFSGYIKDFYADLNGNGKTDSGDRFGISAYLSCFASMLYDWGEEPIKIGENGFVLNIFNERISSIIDKLYGLVNSQDVFYEDSMTVYDVFYSGNSLFVTYGSDPIMLRDIDFDFGYLPDPKFDEMQERYIQEASGGWMGIPISRTVDEVKRTGGIFEAMSAASSKYVADAFAKKYIENKVLRDEDSVNMFHIMREGAFYQRARFFDTTDLLNSHQFYYIQILQSKNGSVNLASQYAKNIDKLQTTLDGVYKMISEN